MKKPELSLPAGSLQCALYAFKGGADAVYLGMKNFSARKSAVNFSFEDLRKLKQVCLKEGKKFYITLNTLVKDEDFETVVQMLKQLDYIGPDAVIIQDLGIAKLVRDRFPSLKMQASTQLACHTVEGVKTLQKIGFKQVVLSRELSFEEIKNIRQACPDVELKVFIHGAQCYGFSGLCMASQKITGRSANCGACAQICRTWFTCEEEGLDRWFFSMKDMKVGEKVVEYAKIGIDLLKVEGRMKGPEYVYWTARYYRLLLDGLKADNPQVKAAEQSMETSFSRQHNAGFFDTGKAGSINSENLVCTTWPGHMGLEVGRIEKVMASSALVRFNTPVALRDGLLVVSNGESSGFALKNIEGNRSFVSKGETVTINFPSNEFKKKPTFNTPVYCTSRHNGNLELLNENLPLYKKPVSIKFVLYDKYIEINSGKIKRKFELETQAAKTQSNLISNLQSIYSASDTSYFTLGDFEFENRSSFENPFIALSVLKQTRRSFFKELDEEFENFTTEIPKSEHPTLLPIVRRSLGLWDNVIQVHDKKYLPLNPLLFDEDTYFANLDKTIAANPDVIVGLNNIAQVGWALKHPDVKVFADIFLYTENNLSWELLKEILKNMVCTANLSDNPDFNVPLFISRVCFRHNSLGKSCNNCTRNNTYTISQNGKSYKVECKNCITTVTEA